MKQSSGAKVKSIADAFDIAAIRPCPGGRPDKVMFTSAEQFTVKPVALTDVCTAVTRGTFS